jgi:integrase
MSNADTVRKQLEEVNGRLKRGEGWVGYRFSKDSRGEKVPSKFLYYAFYQGATQKFVNSKTNNPEDAYRALLKTRNMIADGDTVLPSDVSKLRYEDLKKILMDYYREHKPDSIYTRQTEDGGKEETFLGANKLDHYFKRCPLPEITAQKIQGFIAWRKKEGDADATIRRQLGRLRSAFSRAKALDLITDNHIPTFVLPRDSEPRKGFLDLPDFNTLRTNFPAHLRPTLTFLYYSGCRTGAAKKITWAMVSKDCSEIELPAEIIKNNESLTIPLAGPLEEIAIALREIRKKFPKTTDAVLNFKNFRWAWDKTCCELGLGTFDPQSKKYSGLVPHDFRRSAARNLIKAGVDRRIAMKITGHKTEAIFERYNIKTTEDVKEALVRVGQFKPATVTPIAERSGAR